MIDIVNKQLNNFGQLYSRFKAQEPIAKQLLQVQHFYLSQLAFDPLNGEALPQRMSHRLGQVISGSEQGLNDRFTHIVDHCIAAIGHILLSPRQTVVRVHEMTPVYLAQRLDSRSVQWLSRKPGSNLREKLAANPHILAATRKMSFDTLENRLLKAFLIRVQSLILDRQDAGLRLTEGQETLLDLIQKKLRQEEFSEIKPWQHMPPNNVLLQDKQYRKVWRAWQLLNRLEDDCEHQQKDGVASGFSLFTELLKQLSAVERCTLLDQAWQFKSDHLSVNSSFDNSENLTPVEVLAIDLGNSKLSQETKIAPQAELMLTLSVEGNIRIQRQERSGKTRHWEIEFQNSDGLVELRVSLTTNKDVQKKSWQPAIPENFFNLVKQLVDELLPGDKPLRQSVKPVMQSSTDFASFMFDGASCKLQTTEKTEWLRSSFLDASGLDCNNSKAISADELVFSTRELAQVTGDSHPRCLGSFAELLASQVRASQGMHYLVSDHHSEFETSDLRREMNRNFSHAAPLPKSIAAVYATLEKHEFKRNDLIMVLSSDLDGIYATPIYYCWGNKPGEEYLERHPSIKLSLQGEQQLLEQALVNSGLPNGIAKRFIELYSYREIALNETPLILHDGEHWYRVPVGLKLDSIDISDALFKEANVLQKKVEKTYFLSVSAAIKQQKGVKSTQWLASDPLTGSQRLLQRQNAEPHKIFWKDHLPQLMTRLPVQGIEQDFYFVDNNTSVKPERGIAINIPIEHSFTLPSGQEEIRFTIYQGKDSNRQEFSLLLTLRQALKADCICKLVLTYTYGDDQPYKLRFIPVSTENKPFNYVEAQWGKKQDEVINHVAAIPAFPERLEFKRLQTYAGVKGPTDVIKWIERNLDQLDEIYQFLLNGRNKKRFNFSYQDIDWIPNKDFGFYKSHPDYDSIFVHKSKFESLDTESENYFSGDVRIKEVNKFSLENVSPQGELSEYELKGLSKSWRFPMLTFSEQARCFLDKDIPTDLSQKGNQAIEQAERLIAVIGSSNKHLVKELKQFLSYCHKLMPNPAVDDLLQAAIDKKLLRYEDTRFKYALGDASQPWQKELLLQILEPVDDSGGTRGVTLEILSVAMWRDRSLIHQLTAKQVVALSKRLNEYLLGEIDSLKKEDNVFKWNSFILRLELMLALLRTRESSELAISSLFAIDSNLSQQFLRTVEDITDKQGEALAYQLIQAKVVARVKLEVNKPDSYHRTPDLLYALKLYLSGDDGADKITITELVNNA